MQTCYLVLRSRGSLTIEQEPFTQTPAGVLLAEALEQQHAEPLPACWESHFWLRPTQKVILPTKWRETLLLAIGYPNREESMDRNTGRPGGIICQEVDGGGEGLREKEKPAQREGK